MNDEAWKRPRSETQRLVAEYIAAQEAKRARATTKDFMEDRPLEAQLSKDFVCLINSAPIDGLEDVRKRILDKDGAGQIGPAEAKRLLMLLNARRTRGE
jgi:hypothetical protein